jgi:hypothetical protein
LVLLLESRAVTPLSAEEEKLVDRLARTVVDRQMAVPAVLLLESSKPLAFLGSQMLRFLEPSVRTLCDRPEYAVVTQILEDRDKVEHLLRRIETLEEMRRGATPGTVPASDKETRA